MQASLYRAVPNYMPCLPAVANENDNISMTMVKSLAAGAMRDFIPPSPLLSLVMYNYKGKQILHFV